MCETCDSQSRIVTWEIKRPYDYWVFDGWLWMMDDCNDCRCLWLPPVYYAFNQLPSFDVHLRYPSFSCRCKEIIRHPFHPFCLHTSTFTPWMEAALPCHDWLRMFFLFFPVCVCFLWLLVDGAQPSCSCFYRCCCDCCCCEPGGGATPSPSHPQTIRSLAWNPCKDDIEESYLKKKAVAQRKSWNMAGNLKSNWVGILKHCRQNDVTWWGVKGKCRQIKGTYWNISRKSCKMNELEEMKEHWKWRNHAENKGTYSRRKENKWQAENTSNPR